MLRFEGTQLDVDLAQTDGYGGGPSYFDVLLDGAVLPAPLIVPKGAHAFTVAKNLSNTVHAVELVKRTEARHGVVQVVGWRFPTGGRLLSPPPALTRRIEVISNSAMTGYGMEGSSPECPGGANVYNARKSAPNLAAEALRADLSFVGYSGKGVTHNNFPGDNDFFPILWQRASPDNAALGAAPVVVPDALVLVASGLDAEQSDAMMTRGYTDFVATIRATYPTSHLFLVNPASNSDDWPVGQQTRSRFNTLFQKVAAQRAVAGDSKVYAYAMTESANGQASGCDYHPGAALQAEMAGQLEAWVRVRLGW